MYPLQFHKTLTTEKWAAFTADRQLLMIANELNRLRNGLRTGQKGDDLYACMERAFELLDLTINSHRNSLQRELLYFRDLFAELYLLDELELQNKRVKIDNLYRTLLLLNSKSAALVL